MLAYDEHLPTNSLISWPDLQDSILNKLSFIVSTSETIGSETISRTGTQVQNLYNYNPNIIFKNWKIKFLKV